MVTEPIPYPVQSWKRLIVPLGLIVAVVIGIPVALTGFRSNAFMPHIFCYLNDPVLTWTHVVSDSLIGLSYLAISATLLYIVRRSQGGIPFHWLFIAFGLFIVACGGTHVMEVITVWHPYYWASAAVKVITAGASVATAIALPLVTPTIFARMTAAERSEERRQKLEAANNELQRLNKELREYDDLKNSLVSRQAAQIGSWEWDIKTGANRWTIPVEIMHGLDPGSYDGRYESWWATVHPDDRPAVEDAMRRAFQTGQYDIEYRTVRKDGSLYWTAARGNVLYAADGTAERMLGICMDVTARKKNEEVLLRAEKLAAAGRLAATVAHEINNPLEAVTNLIYLARTNENDPKPLLELAERELSRVAVITRQTLGFYRERSSPVAVEVADLIDEILGLYTSRFEGKGVKIRREFGASPVINVVRGELYQVIANILANAVDASPVNGTVTVRLSETDHVTIEIEDEGPGIAPEVKLRMFEPFFTTKKDVGTGLGLWVSRQLLEQMGGAISYRDGDGGSHDSTCFEIRVPKGRAASAKTVE